ncbi:MAG: carboxylating nicotinate-nucleotide diphosphorylase [Cyclobacteriaceae bacterium]|nr:carboxylating nicotinate-nucleotide diphosphorylase [Cyclobacteriaceae bacterium]
MRPAYITDNFLNQFITQALREDVGEGDHTSLAVIPADSVSRARLLVKEEGVLAGVEVALEIFNHIDATLNTEIYLKDGSEVKPGDVAFVVHGSSRSMLMAERLVLNTMQRMSGIATGTRRLVKLVEGTSVKLLDTRKTTPNFRLLEKWAVVIGGGHNHRLGLFDMIMIKDNHIDIAGGVEPAIVRAKDYLRALNQKLPIEIEVRSLEELDEVLAIGGVDVIMLDNMTPEQMTQAVKRINGRFKTEASGGITEVTIRQIALTGVDYISVGALTHSVRSLDLSLKIF